MEIITRAILFENNEIKIIGIKVTDKNYFLVKKKLESEMKKILDKLRNFKDAGLIKSISFPKNKKIQSQLNELTHAKNIIKQTIKQINRFF